MCGELPQKCGAIGLSLEGGTQGEQKSTIGISHRTN